MSRPDARADKVNDTANKHPRKQLKRAREGHEAGTEIAAKRADRRNTQDERREDRRMDRIDDVLVGQHGETKREAEYRLIVSELRAQYNALLVRVSSLEAIVHTRQPECRTDATAGASGSSASVPTSAHVEPAAGSITAPRRISEVTIGQIREYLGLAHNDQRWNEIRAQIRELIVTTELNLDVPWKKQNVTRLGSLYAVILERIPEFERFVDNWAAAVIVQDAFNHRRGSRNRKNRPPGWQPRPRRTPNSPLLTCSQSLSRSGRGASSSRESTPTRESTPLHDPTPPRKIPRRSDAGLPRLSIMNQHELNDSLGSSRNELDGIATAAAHAAPANGDISASEKSKQIGKQKSTRKRKRWILVEADEDEELFGDELEDDDE